MGVSGPSLFIESTDSMIILLVNIASCELLDYIIRLSDLCTAVWFLKS